MINRVQAHEALDDFITKQGKSIDDLINKVDGKVLVKNITLHQQNDGSVLVAGSIVITTRVIGTSKTPVNKE